MFCLKKGDEWDQEEELFEVICNVKKRGRAEGQCKRGTVFMGRCEKKTERSSFTRAESCAGDIKQTRRI